MITTRAARFAQGLAFQEAQAGVVTIERVRGEEATRITGYDPDQAMIGDARHRGGDDRRSPARAGDRVIGPERRARDRHAVNDRGPSVEEIDAQLLRDAAGVQFPIHDPARELVVVGDEHDAHTRPDRVREQREAIDETWPEVAGDPGDVGIRHGKRERVVGTEVEIGEAPGAHVGPLAGREDRRVEVR